MIEFWKGLFFVRRCLLCGDVLTETKEGVFCPKCRLEYEKEKRRACPNCGEPHTKCACMPEKLKGSVAYAAHLFAYDDSLSKTVIYTLKKRNFKALQRFLGEELAVLIENTEDTAITFAPRKPKSVREYGFDQAKALALVVSDRLDIPLIDLFRHAHFSALQKNLDAKERAENAEKSYTICKDHKRTMKHLIIVDDVMTTGSTMAKLASLTKKAGYETVAVLCVARTMREKEKI